jgi:hypothetical protein
MEGSCSLQGDVAPDVEYRIYVSSGDAYIVRTRFLAGRRDPRTDTTSSARTADLTATVNDGRFQ